MKPINDIPISQIIPGKNDRTIFDESGLRELADSIKGHGLIQPITVRYVEDCKQFEIIAGERRFRACNFLDGKRSRQSSRFLRMRRPPQLPLLRTSPVKVLIQSMKLAPINPESNLLDGL
jgi:ParB family chromosome partitioning protein